MTEVAVSSESLPLGRTVARIATRPLIPPGPSACPCGVCGHTVETTDGFDVIDFARTVLRMPLDPWEEYAVIHGLELLPDGRPRFRTVLVIVARQNGKSFLCTVLTLYWLFVDRWPLVLGTSTNIRYAQEPWEAAVQFATNPALPLVDLMPPGTKGIRRVNGEQRLTTADGCRYEIAASNARGGRSLSIDRLIQDELREQRSWDAWNAAVPAQNARPFAQNWNISNQGDYRSVVLESIRSGALAFIEDGTGDYRTGLFEWSAPPGQPIDDIDGLAAANPNVGRRLDWDTLLGPARRIIASGDLEAANGFRTECRCERVANLNSALDLAEWAKHVNTDGLAEHRARLAAVFDIAPDGSHATLVVAARIAAELYRGEIVQAWDGPTAVTDALRALPALVAKVKPKVFGWFPGGPAAAAMGDLRERKRDGWPPRGVTLSEITGESAAACMGLSALVKAGHVEHPDDALLNAQVEAAVPLRTGDRWVFSRRGAGTVDAVYGLAGAVHLARTLPPPRGDLKFVKAPRRG